MYDEIIKGLKGNIADSELELIKNSDCHLGIFVEPYLTYMLDGEKTIESRFSKKMIIPWNKIALDDIVFVKKSGGDVLAYFKIKDLQFINLDEYSIQDIKKKYSKELCVNNEFWELKKDSKYATLIFIKEIVKIKPIKVTKKGMNSWIKIKKN